MEDIKIDWGKKEAKLVKSEFEIFLYCQCDKCAVYANIFIFPLF